jgi:hypothetical protein
MICIISCSISALETTLQVLSGLPVDLDFDFVCDFDLALAFAPPGSRAFSICCRLPIVSPEIDTGVT